MKFTVSTLVWVTLVCPAGLRAQTVLNQAPSRVVGQPQVQVKSVNPNVPEGREFLNPWGVAVDRSSTPPALYVSDFGNNRVLGWQNAAQFQNGATADIVIGQVDKTSTGALGPGTSRPTGLNGPGGLVVDGQGNLYVADSGNNRILRFPKPFAQPVDQVKFPDLVIGQANFNIRDPNPNGVSERSYATTNGSTVGRNGLAFDPQGNLWASDPLNNRVLRYPAASLREGNNGPAADMVLGQAAYTTNTAPAQAPATRFDKSVLLSPSGIAVDPDGRVYVADEFFRVLVYAPPFVIGKAAARIMGIGVQLPAGQQPEPGRPTITEYTFGSPQGPYPPEGVFMIGNRPAVVDTGNNRILIFDPFAQWPAEAELIPSPPAKIVLGQRDLSSGSANTGQAEPTAATLNFPLAATFHNNEVFVVDSLNNRVTVFPTQTTGAAATRVLGQVNFNLNAVNLVEGRELFLFNGFSANQNLGGDGSDGAGVAIDNASNPPRLYIADTFNNRILGYRDARSVRPGDPADLVIGQNDLSRVLVNAPQNSPEVLTDSGLYRPSGIVVDSNRNLWVADSGNGRVLRFASPFDQTPPRTGRLAANLVIGQESFARKVTDPSARTMADPVGVAFSAEGHLLVSDAVHHRVLLFRKPANGDFTNGMPADRVIGQPDFFTGTRGSGNNRLSGPRQISLDTDDRLFVADAGNSRIVIYDRVTGAANDPPPALSLTGLPNPQGVYASPATGEIWVTATRGSRVLRYPQFNRLLIDPRSDFEVVSNAPLAVTQDQYGTLYVAEAINRVAIYFNALAAQSAGNYAARPLSPGMIALLYPRSPSAPFSTTTASYNELPNPVPLPKELADTQVLFDGNPVPLYFVSPGQINFYIPMGAPTSGAPEVQVVRVSTGQILGSGFLPMARVSPALFVQGGAETGQVAALNQDNTVNEPGNAVQRGQVVQLFGTGQGFVTGAPADGNVPSGPIPTDEHPTVIVNSRALDDADILYSGLAPGLAGVWQLNVRVPEFVPPGNQIDVVVVLRSIPSNQGSRGQIIRTTIAVR